jgi:hypothetical protein
VKLPWQPFNGADKAPWAAAGRMTGGVLKGSTPQERAQQGIAEREEQRAAERKKRAEKAARLAATELAAADRALDTANRAQHRLDDSEGVSEEQQIEVEHDVMLTLRAHERCKRSSVAAAGAARRPDARQAEAHAAAAARATVEAKAAAAAAVKHAR